MDGGQRAEQDDSGPVAPHPGPDPQAVHRQVGARLQGVGGDQAGGRLSVLRIERSNQSCPDVSKLSAELEPAHDDGRR